MHTSFSHFHHVYMRWAFFPLSLVLLFPLFSTTVVLRESLSVTAEKGKPTRKCCCAFPPRSSPPPLLLSSSLLSSLFLLRQALWVARHMTELTGLHVLLILQMWESIKNACCLAAEGKTAYAIQRDKESKRACQEKREKLYSSKHFAGKEKEREREGKNENEVASARMQHCQCFWETAHRCSWPPIGRTSFFVKTPPPAVCSTTITSGDGEKRREGASERERTEQASVASDCLSMQSQHAHLFTRRNAVIRFKAEVFFYFFWIHLAKNWWDVATLNAQIFT